MDTIVDYVRWMADVPVGPDGANEVDNLVFCYLSYLDLKQIWPLSGRLTLDDACRFALQQGSPPESVDRSEQRNAILRAVIDSKRFSAVQVADYADVYDPEKDIQFSATTYLIPGSVPFVAFRGTDDTLAGWKEDLMISFTEPCSQKLALDYLSQAVQRYGVLDAGGHSKGGNLCWYAAMKLEDQAKIRRIYLNDAPGLCPDAVDVSGLQAIRDRAVRIMPEFSVVGRLFEADTAQRRIVRSCEKGMMQHDLASWGVDHGHLDCTDGFTEQSDFIEQGLRRWVEELSLEDRQAFSDNLFDMLEGTGSTGVSQMTTTGLEGLEKALTALVGLDKKTKWTAAMLIPALLADDEQAAQIKQIQTEGFFSRWTKRLSAEGAQALYMLGGGFLAWLMPHHFMPLIVILALWALAAGETALTLRRLRHCGWNLRAEQTRTSLCVVFTAMAVLSVVKQQAAFMLSSLLFGVLFLVLAYHNAEKAKETPQNAWFNRVHRWGLATVYTASGIIALLVSYEELARYSTFIGILLMLDGMGTLLSALRKRVNG